MSTNVVARALFDAERKRTYELLNDIPYLVGADRDALRQYNHSLTMTYIYGRTISLTNYQLWKLRQEVVRNLTIHNINKTKEITMETTLPCHACDTPIEPDDSSVIDGNAYCDDCTANCDRCEGTCARDDMREDGNISLCEDCYEGHYITCEDCGMLTHNDDYTCVVDTYLCQGCYEDGEYHYCSSADEPAHGYESDCSDCNGGSDEYLHNYSYKPDALFHDSRTQWHRSPLPFTRYFGVELETTPSRGNNRDEAQEFIGENISDDILYMKEDSSISSGFEIVTHPMTLQWARNNFPWEMLRTISNMGMRAWNDSNCGLHIHISRTAFRTHSHLAKFLLFVYRNESEMVKFTGRRSHYADYSISERNNFVNNAKGSRYGERHSAVNCRNDATIELRVFRPSLQPATVQAYIEFCDALVVYASTITVEDCVKRDALTFGAFTKWLTTHTDEDYSVLHARIQSRVYSVTQ